MSQRVARRRLVAVPGIVLDDLRRDPGTQAQWSAPVMDHGYAVVLLRSGGFLRRSAGEEAFVDRSGGYLSRHGETEQFAFPLGGEYGCTVVGLTPEAYDDYVVPHTGRSWRLHTDDRFDFRHRALVAAAAAGLDRLEATEGILRVLQALRAGTPPANGDVRAATRAAHLRLVAATQEALSSGLLAADLHQLAGHVGTSAYHLSRTFRRVTGVTIAAYRNRLRVRAVLDEFARGATDLADLATRHGFADQSHMGRTVRRHVGATPAAIRYELSKNLLAARAEARQPRETGSGI